MPMEKAEDFGPNADGSKNEDYCCYCYENGAFFYPEATMEQVIESCLPHVVPDVFADEATARAAMSKHFSTLKCWKKTGMIISFKLKEGVSTEDFLAVSDKIQEQFLAKCKGFLGRQLMLIDGVWTDWMTWETLPDAENSLRKSAENESAQEFALMISEVIEQGLYPLERSY
jgi:hypothetical protein